MPFDNISELPERIRNRFGRAGQEAFLSAFNTAWEGTCSDGGQQGDREQCSFAVATRAAQNVNKALEVELEKAAGSRWETYVPITKLDEEEQKVWGPVLEPTTPDDPDAHGDFYSESDIRAAAERFMKKVQDGDASADGVQHLVKVGTDRLHLIESWIAQEDTKHGDDPIKKGTWMIGAKVNDPELWSMVRSGEFTGFSIGGRAKTG